MLFCRELLYYSRFSYSAVNIENNIFPNGIMKLITSSNLIEEIYISPLEIKNGPINPKYVVSFSKIYIWDLDWGFANSFWDHVIQILFRVMHFQLICFQLWKVKKHFWNSLHLKIKFLFSMNSYVCPMWIFIFDTDTRLRLETNRNDISSTTPRFALFLVNQGRIPIYRLGRVQN